MRFATAAGELTLGVHTPVVIQTPGGHARWEEAAGPEELVRVVTACDVLGYHHLTCSEHVSVPEAEKKWRGAVYWDPVATLGWAAALTSQILLVTNVVVLGYHHPVEILKSYGTLDRLSGGRVVLGVGVGTLREEFELLGSPFADRGQRADDALRAIRDGWGLAKVQHRGPHFEYDGLLVEPHSPRKALRVWVGGRSERSLRRALELGEGWTPFGLSLAEVAQMLSAQKLPGGFEVILPSGPLDPAGAPQRTAEQLDALRRAGATGAHCAFVHHSVDHFLEQLEALCELAGAERRAV
jgi:probable F420-dependent oxidoreductase